MKYFLLLITILFSITVSGQGQIITKSDGTKIILNQDGTWSSYNVSDNNFDYSKLQDDNIPSFLRQGIKVNKTILKYAIEMHFQGWRYTMPRPKSSQAAWGNSDGRTTWFYGYWYNSKTNEYSKKTPSKMNNGLYYGDHQDNSNMYRNGGSPSYPTKLEWLLSSYGGVPPYSY